MTKKYLSNDQLKQKECLLKKQNKICDQNKLESNNIKYEKLQSNIKYM